LVVVAWACACRGRPEVVGEEGVTLAVSLVRGVAVAMPSAATAAARDELGGEANGAAWFVTDRVGVAPWAGVLAGMFWITELVCEGMVAGEVLVKLQLLWGGVVLCWAWELVDLLAS